MFGHVGLVVQSSPKQIVRQILIASLPLDPERVFAASLDPADERQDAATRAWRRAHHHSVVYLVADEWLNKIVETCKKDLGAFLPWLYGVVRLVNDLEDGPVGIEMTSRITRTTRRQRQALAHRIPIGNGNTERLFDVHARELW